MSCVYALLRNKEEAICYLDKSLSKQEITLEHVLNDEDWKEYLDDEEYKAVIEKYSMQQEPEGTMR